THPLISWDHSNAVSRAELAGWLFSFLNKFV
ncbi:MAG: hypothetical protein ACI90V_010611, partial [Bacillariaceae sp.]